MNNFILYRCDTVKTEIYYLDKFEVFFSQFYPKLKYLIPTLSESIKVGAFVESEFYLRVFVNSELYLSFQIKNSPG